MLQCVAVCCSVLQCVAVCCSVLQCVAVNQWNRVVRLLQEAPPWSDWIARRFVRAFLLDDLQPMENKFWYQNQTAKKIEDPRIDCSWQSPNR